MPSEAWIRAQEAERAYQVQKDPASIVETSVAYWRRILALLPPDEVAVGAATRVLDAGCGPAGILLAVAAGERVGFDPLMNFYLERFPHLRDLPMRWIEARAEEFRDDSPFDVVFCVNMLDHTEDPAASAANLARQVAPGGRLVLLLNVHLTRFFRGYFERFHRFIDPPHPHHFHRDDVPALFPGLRPVSVRDCDQAWLELRDLDSGDRPRVRRPTVLSRLLNPFKYPLAAARLAGRPFNRSRMEERPLMAAYVYVFARDRSAT